MLRAPNFIYELWGDGVADLALDDAASLIPLSKLEKWN